jgi:adenylate kinase
MNQVVARRLRERDCDSGCILDGYPRTLFQARFLSRLLRGLKLSQPIVFDLDISSEEVVSRLSRRQRTDDLPEAIRERLRLYHQNADFLVRYYRSKQYYRIAAARTPEEISDELLETLNFPFQPAEAVVRVKKHFYAAACLSRPL